MGTGEFVIEKSSRSSFYRGWQLALVLLLAAISAAAQLPEGTILGVAKDASGGVVPGATITITNTDTNQARTVTTGDDGAYRVPALPVGHYTVKIEKEGFQTETQTGLVLEIGQDLVVNAALQVGTSSQEVVVTGEAPLVNTTNSAMGGLVNEEKMSDLPLNGRNYIDLTLIQPGIGQVTQTAGSGGGAAGIYFTSNGSSIRSNTFTIDGASMVNQFGAGTSSVAGTTLGVDGIKEYKVVTHSFSAEYGQTMGSQMIIVSKGGTNQWSGDAFEYLRNSVMDARNFFDKGVFLGGPRLPEFQRNNFGGSFGGPIRKDKTFFLAVFEGLRENLGVTITDTTLPAACHNLVPVGNGGTTVGMVLDLGLQTAPFPSGANLANAPACAPGGSFGTLNNTGTNSLIPAVVQPWIGQFPLPNLTNNQYTFPASSHVNENYGQMRVDHTFSAADSFFARYTIDNASLYNPTTSSYIQSTASAYPQFAVQGGSRNQFLTLAENHIFSANVLNQIRISFSRTNLAFNDVFNAVPGLNPWGELIGPQWSFITGVEQGSIAPGSGITGTAPGTGFPAYHILNVGTLSDDLFYTHGRHSLKFGTLVNRYALGTQLDNDYGSLAFTNLQGFMLGNGITSYKLFVADPGYGFVYQGGNPNEPLPPIGEYYMWNTIGFYAQDDFRAKPNLTLNFGLRYEIYWGLHELNGRESYIPSITTSSTYAIGTPWNNYSLGDWSPRLGFAWDPTGKGKTSIRGGADLLYDLANFGSALDQPGLGTPPFGVELAELNPPASMVVQTPFTFPTPAVTLQGIDHNLKQPYSIQTNLAVDQQVPFGIALTVAYVGTRGVHLWGGTEGNPCIPTSIVNGVFSWANPTNTVCLLGRVNPALSTATWLTSNSASWYNGVQVIATKQVSHGLEFQVNYTYSHAIDYLVGQQNGLDCGNPGYSSGENPEEPSHDKGPSCSDLRNVLHFNALYHLPELTHNGFLSKITNGWWMGSIVSLEGGYPFTPLLSNQRSLSGAHGTAADRADEVTAASGTVMESGIPYNFVPFNPNTVITGNPNNWFNPLMFDLGPVGVQGNAPRGVLRGPPLYDWDFSLSKDTPLPIGERTRLQFRAEVFNILNRANFGLPLGALYAGATTTAGPYQAPVGASAAAPLGTAGQITTTTNTSRQIQLALKVIF